MKARGSLTCPATSPAPSEIRVTTTGQAKRIRCESCGAGLGPKDEPGFSHRPVQTSRRFVATSLALKAEGTGSQRANSRVRHQTLLLCFAHLHLRDYICDCLPLSNGETSTVLFFSWFSNWFHCFESTETDSGPNTTLCAKRWLKCLFVPAESCRAEAAGLPGGRNPQCPSPEVPDFKGIGREMKSVQLARRLRL